MRGRGDAEPRGRARSLQGGKALQRLFGYLGKRLPEINDEVVAAVPVSKAARPRFGLTAQARRAPVAGTRRTRARSVPAARTLAAAIVKAASGSG